MPVFGYHFYFGAFRIKSIMGDTTLDHDSCYWATVLIDNTGGGELSRGGNDISRKFIQMSLLKVPSHLMLRNPSKHLQNRHLSTVSPPEFGTLVRSVKLEEASFKYA